ncbi:dTDP-4-dehydrorhamnose 3,5-epimerase family protein [Actinotignum sanguinis]|uniref:dTDP-4-dehydrorhamnose 3,5-epimerase n=1 Tax=Schaalia turicensis TaxID=131111 RepID=A0ABZ0RAC2_9ACTO|nr:MULTISPECIES: dTDP-4-dehydrorhamnose 3,5-epimerase [Actinotignum]WPJ88285.1 dTDP-4-dehydrorhamnose 3,5-epimerase [Schaalia turicensis]MDE1552416.1 dTDP-4-dehydrorhamnose 3,5-epimerase [Actinotignum sanguinis]MDE1565084.1 dTDP-4-dehydrorhamnose 3,5-epimerase [Actinotignum sanguinis]MDE1576495.1 dTDP-4-dehydrorhamnose 3,5-epimerase [Actinotignum sanguinis]MDE1641940.1 dTDP-4-dehydrorhamnose 3,5-epimerase [Actinotignum sanguinis]
MEIRELAIAGAWEITTKHFPDERGIFLEAYKSSVFEETIGHRLDVRQVNTSVSKAGTVRGIHFADVPPSQAKYVMCPRGAVLDFVIDIRVGSPTYGKWDSVLLDDDTRKAIYISEGLGHCFVALEDDSTVVYLCSAQYAPGREHGVNPLCSQVGLVFPETDRQGKKLELLLSPKDTEAPGLDEAERSGLLPRYEDVQAFLGTLRS